MVVWERWHPRKKPLVRCPLEYYTGVLYMAHTQHDRKKLLARLRRIRGQLNAVEKALEEEKDCSEVLQTLAACRGALSGLLAEIVEGHIRHHVIDPDKRPDSEEGRAAQELIDVVRMYFK